METKELDIRVCKIDKDELKRQDFIHITENRKGDIYIGGYHKIEVKDAYFVIALMRDKIQNG